MGKFRSIIYEHPALISFLLLISILLIAIPNTGNVLYISLIVDGFFFILGLLGLISSSYKLKNIKMKEYIPSAVFLILLEMGLIIFCVSMLNPIQELIFYNNKVTKIEYAAFNYKYIQSRYKVDTTCSEGKCQSEIKGWKHSFFDNDLGYGQNIIIMNNGDEIKVPNNSSGITLDGSSIMFF